MSTLTSVVSLGQAGRRTGLAASPSAMAVVCARSAVTHEGAMVDLAAFSGETVLVDLELGFSVVSSGRL